MLCVKPEDRPDASKVKMDLEELARELKNVQHASKSVWLSQGNAQTIDKSNTSMTICRVCHIA